MEVSFAHLLGLLCEVIGRFPTGGGYPATTGVRQSFGEPRAQVRQMLAGSGGEQGAGDTALSPEKVS